MALKLVKVTNDINSGLLDKLNEAQQEGVKTIDGPLLIIAGAGSGKTRVLTHRIAYLIEQGINPYNILALTFTNKAAKEMLERISRIVPPESANKVWAGTFHSIFARLLRYEANSIGFTSSFSIYDTEDSLSAVKGIMNNLGVNQQKFSPQSMIGRISWAKNQMIDIEAYSNSAESELEKQTSVIYNEYQKALQSNNAMDFDDLLINMIEVLKHSDDILDKYQNKFRYILVDEYQDTNRAQYIVINMLAKKHKNICVVGDDAQSIYRWRGADIRNILDFQKDYIEAKVVRLEQNYRSTKTILGAADSVIKYNRKQLSKTLWTDNIDGEPVKIIESSDDKEEAERVVSIVSENSKSGNFSHKDFAILYRTNAQSLALENAFKKVQIPYIIIGGISFYQRKEIKDVLAYLKLLVNRQDSESLIRIINEPPRGIGPTSLKYIKGFAEKHNISLYDAFLRVNENEHLQQRAKESASKFIAFIENYRSLAGNSEPGKLAEQYISETGILQMYREINTEDSLDRWNNIQQFLSDFVDYFNRNEEAQFGDYLNQLSLLTDFDQKDTSQEQVKMMTLHSAKGLEFPVVIIAGLEHGLMPLLRADSHFEEEEEERRLFYVGITRAEKLLYLTYARNRMRFGSYSTSSPSKFINEIDQKYLEYSQRLNNVISYQPIKNDFQKPFPSISFKPKKEITSSQDEFINKFKTGDWVNHSHFGKGKIMAMVGTGNNAKAVVNFNSVGKKVLMLQYAKLEKA
ncbi:MAG: UvrD-helicase domain-containing protein [Ignavibacteriae bacterium]|nr:UvrD-helicase domain-containing protein [Ignavibacteriota bacterium]